MSNVVVEAPYLASSKNIEFPGAVVGTLIRITPDGEPVVKLPGFSEGAELTARSCVPLTTHHINRSVLVVFDRDQRDSPVIAGVLQTALPRNEMTAEVDGQEIVLSASEQIVLKCGNASITLTRAGKILIRGAYLSSHSSGVNRIKGATVEIN